MSSIEKHFSRYLEQARIDELREELTAQDYSISTDVSIGPVEISLVAEKGGIRVAYEVVASSRLDEMADEIAAKRKVAMSSGVSRFLISVVSLPKTTQVEINSLNDAIAGYLQTPSLHLDLASIGPDTKLISVHDPEYDSVTIDQYKIRVVGSALAGIAFAEPGYFEEDEEVQADVPFDFDITFTTKMEAKQVHFLAFDTSEFDA